MQIFHNTLLLNIRHEEKFTVVCKKYFTIKDYDICLDMRENAVILT